MARIKYYNGTAWVYADGSPLDFIPAGQNAGDILVWNGSAWQAKAPSRLPAGYQEVEYIESSGTQFIDTGYAPSTDFEIIMECEMPSVTAQSDFYLFGCLYDQTYRAYSFGGYNGKYHAEYGSATAHFFTETAYSGKTTIDYHNGLISISDGTTTDTADLSSRTHYSSSTLLRIFCNNNATGLATQGLSSFKLYSFKIKDGNALARDFIPCYNSDGVIGLFDTVNFKFYTNAGTGTFTKGADVN